MSKVLMLGIVALLLFAACFGGSDSGTTADSQAERKMAQISDAMENGTFPLRLDRAKTEDVIEYMGRTFDEIAPGGGERRELRYRMADGSVLYFAMKPDSAGGLVLDYINARD